MYTFEISVQGWALLCGMNHSMLYADKDRPLLIIVDRMAAVSAVFTNKSVSQFVDMISRFLT